MICNCCKSKFDNINGLKYCPYCGTQIQESIVSNTEQVQDTSKVTNTETKFNTLKMPKITKEQIDKYKKEQFFKTLKKPSKKLRGIIAIITVFFLMAVGGLGYLFFANRPVDEGRIKEDLIGKVVVLPKGTSFEIKKGYIKSFSINTRNTSKAEKKDDINAAVTLNNGTIEVKTLLSLQYVYEGNNKWKISDKVDLSGDTTVKPLVGMDEKLVLDGVKKLNITVGGESKALSGDDVKTLNISSRTPDFENFKEEILVDVSLDNGLVAATGKIKCKLNFENEAWSIASIERSSTEDFALELSPTFSEEKVLEVIKKDVLDQTVTFLDVFGGKAFYVNDSFTKNFNITDKKFDVQNQNLIVTVKRQNTAGEIKSILSTDYTFALSFSKLELLKKSKTIVDSVTIDDMSKDLIVSSIVNADIEGNTLFLWYSDNHKITADEAKTFITNKILSQKGLNNVKYVYGNITYKEGNKQKTTSVVATYFLVYDSSKGYYWKVDRIVGEDSPNYKRYIPEPQ